MISRLRFTRLLATVSIFLFSLMYLNYFHPYLENGQWLNLDNGFTFIIIPDTFLYLDLIDRDNILSSVLSSGVKNTICPSLIWALGQFDWFAVLFINIIFIWFIFFL